MFTVDYFLRFATAHLESPSYEGVGGRVRFFFSFYPLVDLFSILPFYLDLVVAGNLPASQASLISPSH